MTDWQPGEIFKTETERFTLRSLTEDDVGEVYLSWWNDADVQRGLGKEARGWTRADGIKKINRFDNITSFHLGIIVKESGQLIGFYSFFLNPENKSSHANVCIGEKDWWNKGVISEVAAHLIDYRFQYMGVERITGRVVGDNQASISLYRKMGFRVVKTTRKPLKNNPGKVIEFNYFFLTKEEWLRRNRNGDILNDPMETGRAG